MTWQTLQGLIGLYGAIVDRYAELRVIYEPFRKNSYAPYMLCNSMLNARSQSTFKIAPPLSNDQQGLTLRDLEPFIGTSGRVSEVLNRKRKLSLAMIKRLHDGLRIPYECLLASV